MADDVVGSMMMAIVLIALAAIIGVGFAIYDISSSEIEYESGIVEADSTSEVNTEDKQEPKVNSISEVNTGVKQEPRKEVVIKEIHTKEVRTIQEVHVADNNDSFIKNIGNGIIEEVAVSIIISALTLAIRRWYKKKRTEKELDF